MQFSVVAQNLRNEEQVAIIQASTVLSLAEKVSVIVYKKKKKAHSHFFIVSAALSCCVMFVAL